MPLSGQRIVCSSALVGAPLPHHPNLFLVASVDAETQSIVKPLGAIAAHDIKSQAFVRGVGALLQLRDKAGADSSITSVFNKMELIEMNFLGRLGDLKPANIGSGGREDVDLFEIEALCEARENSFLVPSALGDQERPRTVQI